jgi:hypothetical protein
MSSPLQFGGPVSLPADPTVSLGAVTKQYCDSRIPYSYFQMLAAPGGMAENLRFGSYTQTIPFWQATAATTTSVKTVNSVFAVGWDSKIPSRVVNGFQFWISTAPSAATQTPTFSPYTGSTLSSLTQLQANSTFTIPLATTGLKQVPFTTPITVVGNSYLYIGLQFSMAAPASGSGCALACTPQASSSLPGFGGKYGEWTGSTVTPGSTIDLSGTASSAVLGQLVWVALY